MGIIACYTPDVGIPNRTIPRKKRISADDIKQAGPIMILSPKTRGDDLCNQLTYSIDSTREPVKVRIR